MPSWDVHFDLHVAESEPALAKLIASIRANAQTVSGIPLPPRVQAQLHRLNIIRAVRGTTGLEGVDMSEEEVRQAISASEGEPPPLGQSEQQVREVQNANRLMQFVEACLGKESNQPLTEHLIRQFHAILTDGVHYPNNIPGRYRSANVSAGDYHAPDYTDVPRLMTEFIVWLNQGGGRALDPIVKAVAAHFLLVSIHPFGDGNGRVSRGVESYLLYQAGVNVRGFYSLANYFYEHRHEYIEMLTHVRFRSDPDLTPFVRFALDGLAAELERVRLEVIAQVRIIAFKDFAREQIAATGSLGRKSGDRRLMLVLGLVGEGIPAHDVRSGRHPLASLYRGLGARTLARDLNALRELKLITVQDGLVSANLWVMDQSWREYERGVSQRAGGDCRAG